jgi:hypothetical protein
MSGQRKTALLLHGLVDADRDWILEQLPAGQQTVLRGLLEEIQALRIPADAAKCIPQPAKDVLEDVLSEQACSLLCEEPVWVLSALLALPSASQWRTRLLDALRLDKRRMVEHAAVPTLAPRMRDALEARFGALIALGPVSVDTTVQQTHNWFGRIAAKVGAWRK